MSTRCQIGFYGEEGKLRDHIALLYKHCDGYPEGVLVPLMPFLKNFFKMRKGDMEYAAARTLQMFMNQHPKDYLGYGISSSLHWDIAYFYVVLPDKVSVYKVSFQNKPKRIGHILIEKGGNKKYVLSMARKLEAEGCTI